MDERLSLKIKYLNLILSFMIVVLHSTFVPELSDSYIVNMQVFVMRIIAILASVTVPFFFTMSSYLFFVNYNGYSAYKRKLKGRFKSLLLPYFFWSISLYIYYFVLTKYTTVFDSKSVPDDSIGIVKYIINCTANPPLWYLQVLIILAIISPLVFKLLKSLGRKSWILILVSYLLNISFQFGYTTLVFWLPQIFMGGWFAIYGQKFVLKKILITKLRKVIFYLMTVGALSLSIILHLYVDEKSNIFYTWRVLSPILVWFLADYMMIDGTKHKTPLFYNTFFIYCTHFIVIEAVRGVLLKFFGKSEKMILVVFCLTIALTYGLIHIISITLAKHFASLWHFLNGK